MGIFFRGNKTVHILSKSEKQFEGNLPKNLIGSAPIAIKTHAIIVICRHN